MIALKNSRIGMEGWRDGGWGVPSVYLEHFGSNAHTESVKQEIEGNQTLVDWLVESGGFDFDPHSTVERDSKEKGEARRNSPISRQWPANLLMQFSSLT